MSTFSSAKKTAKTPIIHVGFAHSGTTSLQENIFSKRSDLFYVGLPYGELGGIFSWVKSREPDDYDHDETAALCEQLIFQKMQSGQRLVISDETLVEQPEIYYTSFMVPVRTIAERLHALFGGGTVLFTLRNQLQYVISMYQVSKRNYAALAGRTIEPFDEWFAGNQTQVANLFLRNLDPSRAIRIYESVFGADAVHVLPLEVLVSQGKRAYFDRLSEITGLDFSAAEIDGYVARNSSPRHDVVLSDEQREIIRQKSMNGNLFLENRFDLPLREFGYPLP